MSTLNYSRVNLLDTPTYTCYAEVLDQTMNITVTWLERLKKRAITVIGGNGDVYLQNTVINVGEPLKLTYHAKKGEADRIVALFFLPETDVVVDYLNWSRNMFLVFYEEVNEE